MYIYIYIYRERDIYLLFVLLVVTAPGKMHD